jgi:hypothetical protein
VFSDKQTAPLVRQNEHKKLEQGNTRLDQQDLSRKTAQVVIISFHTIFNSRWTQGTTEEVATFLAQSWQTRCPQPSR